MLIWFVYVLVVVSFFVDFFNELWILEVFCWFCVECVFLEFLYGKRENRFNL